MEQPEETNQPTGYVPTATDMSRVVVSALGGEIKQYPIRGEVDWDEVVRMYGERFRGGRLLHYGGDLEFDDSSYYTSGEVWVIAAADVENPGRVIAECLLREIRDIKHTQDRRGIPVADLSFVGFSFGNYSEHCDDTLLFQNGIVFAYEHRSFNEAESLNEMWEYFDDSERLELDTFRETV